MNFSAAWSSSPVLTPGRILPASRFIVLTRMSPAAAIRSISSGLFLMITACSETVGRLDVILQPQGRDHGSDVVVHLGLLARPVDAAHQPPLVVVVDERLCLIMVDAQPVLDDLWLVVVALDQPRAVLVAHPLVLGRVELDVVVVARLDAHAAAR